MRGIFAAALLQSGEGCAEAADAAPAAAPLEPVTMENRPVSTPRQVRRMKGADAGPACRRRDHVRRGHLNAAQSFRQH